MKWFTEKLLPSLITASLLANFAAMWHFSERITRLEARLEHLSSTHIAKNP